MTDLLDSKKLVAQLTAADDSISRAGRNCATGLTRRGGANGSQSARGPTGQASPSHAAAPSGSLSSRGVRSKEERAAVKALNITSAVNDHKHAFGRGISTDDGHRRELCSSPRPHPEYDAFMLSEFQAGRRQAFTDIQDRADGLELLDAEAVEDELSARAPLGVVAGTGSARRQKQQHQQHGAVPAFLPALPTTPRQTSDVPATAATGHGAGGGTTPRALSPGALGGTNGGHSQAAASHHPSPVVPAPPAGAKPFGATAGRTQTSPSAVASPASATQQQPHHYNPLSPRGPKAPVPHASAAFVAPERFASPKKVVLSPDVGHYRPKFGLVHSSPTRGKIDPLPSNASRLPRGAPEKEPIMPMSAVIKAARESVKPRALVERAERRAAEAEADDDDDMMTTRRKGAGAPQPSRHSSPAFKSKVAAVTVASAPTAAPDAMYWPQAENGTHRREAAAFDFSKQTPRPPLAQNAVLPDPRSVVTAFSPDVARNAPSFEKYSPRKGIVPRTGGAPDAPLAIERADHMRYPRAPAADFGTPASAASSPRTVGAPGDKKIAPTVSVETVAEIRRPGEKAVHVPNFSAMQARRDPKPAPDLPALEVDYSAVEHRARAATVRADATGGHDGGVFSVSRDMVTEVGAYNPDINAVRARTIRNVDLEKGVPRKEPRANLADLTYDVKLVSPRVQGNPMIASQVSRAKREHVLAAKSHAADVTYDVPVPKLSGGMGMMDIGRQVDRRCHAPGRGAQSDRTTERQRAEQEAAAEAATAKLAAKSSNSGNRRRARNAE